LLRRSETGLIVLLLLLLPPPPLLLMLIASANMRASDTLGRLPDDGSITGYLMQTVIFLHISI
jgi:hypothetical protein